MLKSFNLGGIHPPENKISREAAIEKLPLPEVVTIPISQHIGAPAVAVVAKGDSVVVGQLIAKAGGFVSSNIHSSVSGCVTAIGDFVDASGVRRVGVTIKVEGDTWLDSIDRSTILVSKCDLDPTEIISKISDMGVVGMGGATFPTQVKLSVPDGKKAVYLIINGVECEPYLTADHRVMLERAEEMVVGISILARALGVVRTYIGVENNKADAISHLANVIDAYPNIDIIPLKVKYPQGGEKQLIDALVDLEVPSGAIPIEVGAVVHNVGTALAIYEAVQKNKPLIERVVTVTGKKLENPSNLMVRIGTSIDTLITYCGGMPENSGKVIGGGPMMGRAMCNLSAPVTKGTSGVLIMPSKESMRRRASVCIKCAKCVGVCPMGLEPYLLYKLTELGRIPETEGQRVTDCIECGSCSFACPASLPLLDLIKLGKNEVLKSIRTRK